jgi:hypothetical protein
MQYGIRLELPEHDPMANLDLIGDQFPQEKWFATEAEREQEFLKLTEHHPYYRREDFATFVLTKLEKD